MLLYAACVPVDTAGMLTYQKCLFCSLDIARSHSQVCSARQNKTKPVNLKLGISKTTKWGNCIFGSIKVP